MSADHAFLGHPRGLGYLAFTEMWERFSYYGMGALLVLYMVQELLLPGNVLGLPSASVPAGLVEGLPVGVLLTGSRFNDHLCLDAAEMVERAMGVTTPIDPPVMHRSGNNFGITT